MIPVERHGLGDRGVQACPLDCFYTLNSVIKLFIRATRSLTPAIRT